MYSSARGRNSGLIVPCRSTCSHRNAFCADCDGRYATNSLGSRAQGAEEVRDGRSAACHGQVEAEFEPNKAQVVELVQMVANHWPVVARTSRLLFVVQGNQVLQPQSSADRHRLQDCPRAPTVRGASVPAR